MADVDFPELRTAARRLGLDDSELAEAALAAMDSGLPYWAALHQATREAAQQRGIYDGETRAQIDAGDVFLSRGMPMILTGARMLEAAGEDRLDVFDMLSIAGLSEEMERDDSGMADYDRRRNARLAIVEVDG